jgi:hypothetical protein
MCIYGISNQELYMVVNDALDSIEGDFTKKQLVSVLDEIKRDYKYTSDKDAPPDKGKVVKGSVPKDSLTRKRSIKRRGLSRAN